MSEEADEIANRIFEACSPKSRFHRDMVTAMHKAEIKTGDGYEIISSSIADQLIKLGYVKVVLCRDCWKWGKDDCPVGDSWDDDDFCCYGEAKEDTNDAV